MTKYLISFPSSAMVIPEGEFQAVVDSSHAVVREASVPPVMVAADGTVTEGTYPQTRQIEGGYTVLDVPSREVALEWAAKIAAGCRCAQEVRAFGYDPES